MSRYLDAAQSAIQTLLEKQTARVGGKSDGTLCITVTRMVWDTVRVAGALRGVKILLYHIEGSPMEL